MARKKKHEEHVNHEAWAIPYGDLVTLLLALFVVLYSMSSVNEGKYRVLSDSLNAAFHGKPRASRPIQIGSRAQQNASLSQKINPIVQDSTTTSGPNSKSNEHSSADRRDPGVDFGQIKTLLDTSQRGGHPASNLNRIASAVRGSLGSLIDRKLISVRQSETWLEIEIRTDILFASGAAQLSDSAVPILAQIAESLNEFPNLIRIEGHTDNVPISTAAFPSNWQLSSARAASVVRLLAEHGVDPVRMSVVGFAEYHPVASNDTVDGRNRNRRVLMVILGREEADHSNRLSDYILRAPSDVEASHDADANAASSAENSPNPAALQKTAVDTAARSTQ